MHLGGNAKVLLKASLADLTEIRRITTKAEVGEVDRLKMAVIMTTSTEEAAMTGTTMATVVLAIIEGMVVGGMVGITEVGTETETDATTEMGMEGEEGMTTVKETTATKEETAANAVVKEAIGGTTEADVTAAVAEGEGAGATGAAD